MTFKKTQVAQRAESYRHIGSPASQNPQTENNNIGMYNYFLSAITTKAFQFSGRARRKEYWSYNLFAFILGMILSVTFDISGISPVASTLLIWVIFLAPGISVTVRRLHDTGRSGWYYLWALLPLVGFILLLIFALLPSEEGANRYGPQP